MIYAVDRHGEAIEADLHQRFNLDLLDFFRGRYKWAKLARLVEVLSRTSTSYYRASLAQDEELARQIIDREEELRKAGKTLPAPELPMEDWSPVLGELMKMSDRLAELIGVNVAAAGGRPGTIRPARRPRTAYDRLQAAARLDRHFDLVSEVEAAQERHRKR